MVKRALSFAARSAAFSKFIALLEQADGGRPNLLGVLTYHRIDRPDAHPALFPGLISATPEAFDQQMSYLAANCHVVSIPELLDVYRNGTELPPRSVMVTFDDAYCDFAEHAWPILKRYRLPVTLFVPTAFPDRPEQTFWWDRLYQAVRNTDRRDDLDTPLGRLSLATANQRVQTFKQLKDYVKTMPHAEAMAWLDQICDELGTPHPEHSVLGWDTLRQLAREGVTLGAHTRTHPLMNRVSPEEAQAEAAGSLRDLEREIGPVPPIFAFPSGGFNDEAVRALEREGFVLAFTTGPGINHLRETNWLRLRRINVSQRATVAVLRARLLSWSVYFNRWRPLSGT